MKTITLTNQDAGFYQRMGPFLASRAVIKAIGYSIYDDDGKTWHLALNNDAVIGFCYTWPRPSKLDVGSFYVAGDDAEAAATALCKSIIHHMTAGTSVITTRIEAVCRGAKKAGFKGKLPKGEFTNLDFTKA